MQLARLRAIAQNVKYRVSFTPGSDEYILERFDPDTSSYAQEGVARQLSDPDGPYYRAGVDLTSPAGSIVFQTKGTSPGGITATLTSGVCNKTKNVSVSWTGRVQIQ